MKIKNIFIQFMGLSIFSMGILFSSNSYCLSPVRSSENSIQDAIKTMGTEELSLLVNRIKQENPDLFNELVILVKDSVSPNEDTAVTINNIVVALNDSSLPMVYNEKVVADFLAYTNSLEQNKEQSSEYNPAVVVAVVIIFLFVLFS